MSVPSPAFLLPLRSLPCSWGYRLLLLFHKLLLGQTLHILHGLHAVQLLREQELLLGLRGRLQPHAHQLFSTDWRDWAVSQLLSTDWGDWTVPGLLSTGLSLISTYMLRVEMVTPQGSYVKPAKNCPQIPRPLSSPTALSAHPAQGPELLTVPLMAPCPFPSLLLKVLQQSFFL